MMRAQQAVAQAVEGADPHAARVDRQHGRDAREHLPGSLVGEGHREQRHRTHLPGLDQPRDPRRQYAGLAAARAREDQRRHAREGDRFELLRVEAVENGRGHERSGL